MALTFQGLLILIHKAKTVMRVASETRLPALMCLLAAYELQILGKLFNLSDQQCLIYETRIINHLLPKIVLNI